MFKNKKLFFISLIVGVIVFGVPFFSFMFGRNKSDNDLGILFIFSSIICFAMYTLMYISLNKKPIIKKIYKVIVAFSILLLSMGILLVIFC